MSSIDWTQYQVACDKCEQYHFPSPCPYKLPPVVHLPSMKEVFQRALEEEKLMVNRMLQVTPTQKKFIMPSYTQEEIAPEKAERIRELLNKWLGERPTQSRVEDSQRLDLLEKGAGGIVKRIVGGGGYLQINVPIGEGKSLREALDRLLKEEEDTKG